MSNVLSYSQIRLYSTCGQKYKYHYIDKLREKVTSGALLFGSAFDKAIGHSLLKGGDGIEEFDRAWMEQEINKRPVKLSDSLLVVYAQADFDADLLTEEDIKFLKAKATELVHSTDDVKELYAETLSHKKQKAYKKWPENEHRWYNLCNWCSLRRKGHLMLKAHSLHIRPKIKEVVAVQKKIGLDNGQGDSLVGYIDLVCKWEDGRTIIFDYKTSAMEYEEDAVEVSPQLAIYSHSEGIKTCGFIVFRKNILKNRIKICSLCGNDGSGARHKTCAAEPNGVRCNGKWVETIKPEVDIQILIADIPARTNEIVLENIEAVSNAIDNKVFVRNLNSCKSPFLCPYLDLCFKGKANNLEKV